LRIDKTEYIGSYHREDLCPKDGMPEFAFIGRSNVGKSSLINLLIDRKDLAKVSKQPGKTKSLNYFLVDKAWYLVDLPGYGYARASHSSRDMWQKMITFYFKNRAALALAFVLIDSRHPLQKIDKEFITWFGENEIPFSIIYTKSDKVSSAEKLKNIQQIENKLLETWEELPPSFITSSEDRIGREELLEYMGSILSQYSSSKK
jgi:GTP-binding protein